MINPTRTRTAGAWTAALLMLLGILAIPMAALAAPVSMDDELTTEDGPTDILGGGDHFFVKFGTDAAFGIVWGTDDVENNVYFVVIKARYLGVAQVYDREGDLVTENHTIKVYTMYAVKLDDILEFDDGSLGDGALNYYRAYNGTEFTGYVNSEPIYKKADLKTSWDATAVESAETDDGVTWTFGLTAKDLSYQLIDPMAEAVVGDGVLNNFTLTFHLEAKLVQVDNVTMPQWRVTVTRGLLGMMWFYGIEKLEDKIYSGKIVSYDVKWDQMIEGWDFDPANENPKLLMEFESVVGDYIPPTMAAWMELRMLAYMHAVSVMNCAAIEGDLEVNETTGTYMQPKQLIRERLTFGSDWQSVGNLTWVDNVTVDGVPEQVTAQIMAGHRFAAIGQNGATFLGFIALGGMVFPGGNLIAHDPTFSSTAVVDLDTDDGPALPIGMIVLGLAAVVIVIAIAVVTLGKKPGKGVKNTFERTRGSQRSDWAKYYDKK